MFNDRIDATRQLAEELWQCRGQNPLARDIPRDGCGRCLLAEGAFRLQLIDR